MVQKCGRDPAVCTIDKDQRGCYTENDVEKQKNARLGIGAGQWIIAETCWL